MGPKNGYFLRVNTDFSLAQDMKSCGMRSRNSWDLRWMTGFGYNICESPIENSQSETAESEGRSFVTVKNTCGERRREKIKIKNTFLWGMHFSPQVFEVFDIVNILSLLFYAPFCFNSTCHYIPLSKKKLKVACGAFSALQPVGRLYPLPQWVPLIPLQRRHAPHGHERPTRNFTSTS